jgi:hypothetical protein
MVPMEMRKENVAFDMLRRNLAQPFTANNVLTQFTNSAASIENDESVLATDLHTRCIAAIFESRKSWPREAAVDPPKLNLHGLAPCNESGLERSIIPAHFLERQDSETTSTFSIIPHPKSRTEHAPITCPCDGVASLGKDES